VSFTSPILFAAASTALRIAVLLPPILISARFMSLLTLFGEEWVDWQNWDRNKGAP
jgi:hypothetical protein